MFIGGASMLIFASLGWLNVFVIMLPVALFCIGAGFSFANASAGAFHAFPKIAGAASALFGCLQIFGGAAASAVMASLHVKNQVPLGSVLLCLSILSFLSWKCLATSKR
jgi:MFS transporter, DHA1 family, 2-module integral membrane pump EmrD